MSFWSSHLFWGAMFAAPVGAAAALCMIQLERRGYVAPLLIGLGCLIADGVWASTVFLAYDVIRAWEPTLMVFGGIAFVTIGWLLWKHNHANKEDFIVRFALKVPLPCQGLIVGFTHVSIPLKLSVVALGFNILPTSTSEAVTAIFQFVMGGACTWSVVVLVMRTWRSSVLKVVPAMVRLTAILLMGIGAIVLFRVSWQASPFSVALL